MATALQCDRCKDLYKLPEDNGLPFAITKKGSELDLCPACLFDLEDFMNNISRKKKTKRIQNISAEQSEKKSEFAKELHAIAKEERGKNPELNFYDSMKVAGEKIKKSHERNFTEIPKEKIEIKSVPVYRCTMCGKGKFDKPHQMCEECESDFPVASAKTKKSK
jgi:hypothetical protein